MLKRQKNINRPVELSFAGKTVLVTGGTQGIGAAIVKDFARAGANLVVTGVLTGEECAKLNRNSNTVQYVHADFTDRQSMQSLFTILDDYKKIDVCINNAGTNRNNPIDLIKDEDYKLLMDVNLHAPFLITRFIGAKMKKNGYGRIVNIASIWSIVTKSMRAAYSMTKAGLVGLTKTSAVEFGQYNVLVNSVSPGFTLTELTKKTLKEKEKQEVIKTIPMARFAEPHEIAKLVLFLSSDLNTYITGQNIAIDGGFTCV